MSLPLRMPSNLYKQQVQLYLSKNRSQLQQPQGFLEEVCIDSCSRNERGCPVLEWVKDAVIPATNKELNGVLSPCLSSMPILATASSWRVSKESLTKDCGGRRSQFQ
ncbi:hypothetical protein ACHAW6_003775 [Cyclotella cf. meneghiniana]